MAIRLRLFCVVFALVVFGSTIPAASQLPLYSFCSQAGCNDGYYPSNPLIQASDGNFYSTVSEGGPYENTFCTTGCGSIFKLTPAGVLTNIYFFCSQPDGYNCIDGALPVGPLVEGADGNLYGTAEGGGAYDGGMVYKVTPGGVLTTVYSFCAVQSCQDGDGPEAGLILANDGNFYGTAYAGGANNGGTVFKLTPSGTLTTLYSFCSKGGSSCTDGEYPNGLLQGADSNFYGTTQLGGANKDGTVFKLTSAGVLTVLHSFDYADGKWPAGLVQAENGTLYGTTPEGGGGEIAVGAFYGVTPTGTFNSLYSFCAAGTSGGCPDGANPYGTLALGGDGNLYGTNSMQGSGTYSQAGTVYELTPAGTLSTIYNFCSQPGCKDGANPEAGLVLGSTGLSYGPTASGGANVGSGQITCDYDDYPGCGTVFGAGGPGAPIQLTLSSTSVDENTPVTLSWKVTNAYSLSMQQCYAFVQGGYAAAGQWTGLQPGTLSGGNYSGSAQITPTDGGVYTYALTCGGTESGFATLTVSGGTLTILTTSLPNATPSVAYSAMLVTQGGTPPYTWSVASGSLPAGLTLNASTGGISGTPTTPGKSTFTIAVKDSASSMQTESLSITVVEPLVVTTTALPNGNYNVLYPPAGLEASGGTVPYTWTINTGTLPTGMTLNSTTGVITGIPTGYGAYDLTFVVTDSGRRTATESLTLTIDDALAVVTNTLTTGGEGASYSTTLGAVNGEKPYTWSIIDGTLPKGLSLTPSTGVISGTPTATGTSTFVAMVTDNHFDTSTATLSVTVNPSTTVRITTTSLPNGTQGVGYSAMLAATSGIPPYTWSVYSGSLPPGLTLNASTGVISGTPTQLQTAYFVIQVEGSGKLTALASLSINVVEDPLQITTVLLETGAVGTAYSTILTATGGYVPYTWSLSSGTLPAGLSLNATTGAITGKPTTAETEDFTVLVTDEYSHSATASLSLTIYSSSIVRITTTSLPNGTVGTAYSATMEATSGTKPYTWSVYSGSLPTGLSLNASTGVISGTPTVAGASDFFIAVKGAGAYTATASLSITLAQ